MSRPDALIHHFAMAAVAFNAAWIAPIFYGVFYLGMIEMSTLPLNVHEYYAHAAKVRFKFTNPHSPPVHGQSSKL